MPFEVIIGPRAMADIVSTVAWLEGVSKMAARRWRTGLRSILTNLETDPQRYSQAAEAADVGLDLRQLLYGRGGACTAFFSRFRTR